MSEEGTEPEKATKRPSIAAFHASMTPEQKIAFYRRNGEIARERTEQRKREREQAEREAKQLLPKLLAEQMSQDIAAKENDRDYVPNRETLTKLRSFMESGLTIEEMRSQYFGGLTEKSWQRLMKFLFKDSVGQVEDLGLEILSVKKKHLTKLDSRARQLRKEIRAYKLEKKHAPPALYKLLSETENEALKIEMDVSKVLHSLGAVGEKASAPTMHLHFSTPRPKDDGKEVKGETVEIPTLDSLTNA